MTAPIKTLSIRRLVLLGALRLSMVWDLVTTFIGILIILDGDHVISYGIALIGALTVVALNFSTRVIWSKHQAYRRRKIQFLPLRGVWLMAIIVDFWTSLTANAWFISPNPPRDAADLITLLASLSFGQLIIVIFVTAVSGISPMMVGYFRDREMDFLD